MNNSKTVAEPYHYPTAGFLHTTGIAMGIGFNLPGTQSYQMLVLWLLPLCLFIPCLSWLTGHRVARYLHQRGAILHRLDSLAPTIGVNNGDDVEVYSTIGCKYCKLAKLTLANEGVRYVSIDVESDDVKSLKSHQQERYLDTKGKTVPQIYIGNELLGGCDNLLMDIKKGVFKDRLTRNNITIYGVNDVCTTDIIPATNNSYTHNPLKALNLQNVDNAVGNRTNTLDVISLSSLLQSKALQLLDKYSVMYSNGSNIYVNYNSMRSSNELQEYIQTTSILSKIPLALLLSLSNNGKLAFFINLYNSLIIHAYCVVGAPADTPTDRSQFFSGKSGAYYSIDGYTFSPDDIEHGILRANSPHPSGAGHTSYYSSADPRSHLSLAALDPRIHFVLSCGASSCPPIKILTEKNIDEALALASASYLSNEVAYNESSNSFHFPKLLLWYGKDFIPPASGDESANLILLRKIYQLMNKEQKLNEILRDNKNVSIEFNDYNWSPNGVLNE